MTTLDELLRGKKQQSKPKAEHPIQEMASSNLSPPQKGATETTNTSNRETGHVEWTAERLALLEQEMSTSTAKTQKETIAAISQKFRWPLGAVHAQVYQIKRNRREAKNVLGGTLHSQMEETRRTSAEGVDEERQVDTVPLQRHTKPFVWEESMVEDLREAFLQSAEESTRAACRSIADQFQWPFNKVLGKVYSLKLPRIKAYRQAQAAKEHPVKDRRENTLPQGIFLWSVRVAREPLQRWQLDYSYGQFPESLRGQTVFYNDTLYRVDRIYAQEVFVSSLAESDLQPNILATRPHNASVVTFG